MNTRYEFNMDVPPREAIRLLYVSKSRFGGDWNSVPHTHSCTEVFYCVDGRGQFNVEGKMLDVAPDDMVIVNPRTLHTELSYQANPLEYIVLGIEGIEILFEQKDRGYTMLKCSSVREELLSLMKMLLREIDAREDGCEMVCQDLTEVLLVKIVRMASVSLRLTAPPSESKECAAAKRYIDENYSESITLDKLAEIAHVNKYYLSVADGLFCREIDGLFCRSSPDIIVRRRCVLSHKRRGWLQPSPSFRYSRNLALQDELYHPVINNGPAVLVCVDKRLGTGPVNQSRDAG